MSLAAKGKPGFFARMRGIPSLPALLLAASLPLLFASGCHKAQMRRETFFPEKLDGVYVFNMASLQDDRLLSGAFNPPRMMSGGSFSRKLLAPGGRVAYWLRAPEDMVVRVAVAAANGLSLRQGKYRVGLEGKDALAVLPAASCREGGNDLELLLGAGEVQLQKLEIYPRRLLRMTDFRKLMMDAQNIFLPARLRFTLKPLPGEELWLRISWKQGGDLEFIVDLQGEKSRRTKRLHVKSGEEFSVPLLPGEYQQVDLALPGGRQGMLRLETSELRRPLPKLDKAELQARARGKNVLLLLLDAARPDRLQVLGNRRAVAPEIDRIARSGIAFSDAVCEAAYTVASTGTLLTGLPAEFHGVTFSFNHALGGNFTTLAEMFKAKGFYTASASANPNYGRAFNYDRGYERFDELFKANPLPQARDFLPVFQEYLGEAGRQGKPFFVYLHLLEPHQPYTMPAPFIGKFQHTYDRQSAEFQQRVVDITNGLIKGPQAVSWLRDCYDESYHYADDAVGRLLELLRARKLEDETIVIILSDHGEGLAEHGLIGHNVVWFKEGIRSLQVWRFPGYPARIERKPVLTSDVFVTLGDAFGLPNAFQSLTSGENVFALPAERRRLTRLLKTRNGYPGFIVEQYPYKLVLYYPFAEERNELYDLARDPGEKTNVYRSGAWPVRGLLHYLRNHLQRAAMVPRRRAKQKLLRQDIESLKALGYIND
jgi:arylsulfatase A-like enzyme